MAYPETTSWFSRITIGRTSYKKPPTATSFPWGLSSRPSPDDLTSYVVTERAKIPIPKRPTYSLPSFSSSQPTNQPVVSIA